MLSKLKNLFCKAISLMSEDELNFTADCLSLKKPVAKSFRKLSSSKEKKSFLKSYVQELGYKSLLGKVAYITLLGWSQELNEQRDISLITSGERLSDEKISALSLEVAFITEGVELSGPAKNALKKFNEENPENRIRYMYQLVTRSKDTVEDISGMGPKGFITVEKLLDHYELDFDFVIPSKDMKKILKKIKANKKEKKRFLKESKKSKN